VSRPGKPLLSAHAVLFIAGASVVALLFGWMLVAGYDSKAYVIMAITIAICVVWMWLVGNSQLEVPHLATHLVRAYPSNVSHNPRRAVALTSAGGVAFDVRRMERVVKCPS
jgi:hypothetical protein